jgi:hypothetical protein
MGYGNSADIKEDAMDQIDLMMYEDMAAGFQQSPYDHSPNTYILKMQSDPPFKV